MRLKRLTLGILAFIYVITATVVTAETIAPQIELIDTTETVSSSTQAAPDSGMPNSAVPNSVAPLDTALQKFLPPALDFSGTLQLKGLYHNFTSDRDADKQLSLQLRRFRWEIDGNFDPHFGFRAEFSVDGANNNFGVEKVYLVYSVNDWLGFKGGKMKRFFSQEALQSSNSLYTIERGDLYHNFLTKTTGYAYLDLGLAAYGAFPIADRPIGYEIGVFNGKQNNNTAGDYGNQQIENLDKGFKAKDVVLRLTGSPIDMLKLEAAVSTKAAEDTSDSFTYDYAVNTAYEVGSEVVLGRLRMLGEVAWGDNHARQDARIINGDAKFFAFYATGIWHEAYSHGRASELVLKMEGLDPTYAMGSREGKPNDGKFRYTLGVNYFFTPQVSAMANYGILQPITKVPGEKDLSHDLEMLWRMNW